MVLQSGWTDIKNAIRSCKSSSPNREATSIISLRFSLLIEVWSILEQLSNRNSMLYWWANLSISMLSKVPRASMVPVFTYLIKASMTSKEMFLKWIILSWPSAKLLKMKNKMLGSAWRKIGDRKIFDCVGHFAFFSSLWTFQKHFMEIVWVTKLFWLKFTSGGLHIMIEGRMLVTFSKKITSFRRFSSPLSFCNKIALL